MRVRERESVLELEQSAHVRFPGTARIIFIASGTLSPSLPPSPPPSPLLATVDTGGTLPDDLFIA